jgi:hypothetical protein
MIFDKKKSGVGPVGASEKMKRSGYGKIAMDVYGLLQCEAPVR